MSGFTPLTIVGRDEEPSTALVPAWSGAGTVPFAVERDEQSQLWCGRASGAAQLRWQSGDWISVAELSDVDLTFYVTSGRLVIHCAKFDKGGGWVGHDPEALPVDSDGTVIIPDSSRVPTTSAGSVVASRDFR